MGRLCWRVGLGERHDALDDVGPQRLDARRPRLIAQETVIPFLHEALLPAPDTGLRFPSPAHDLVGADTVGAQQHDLSPPDMLVWRVAVPREPLQTTAISGLKIDGNSGSHAPNSHTSGPLGIPSGIQMSRRNPLARSIRANEAIMSLRFGYVIGGLAILVISFVTTLAALDYWWPPGEGESAISELPKLPDPGMSWVSVKGLKVQAVDGLSAVPGEPILRLIPTPTDGVHRLRIEFTGLEKNHLYRISAWVKPQPAGNVQIAATDNLEGRPSANRGEAAFDLRASKLIAIGGAVTAPGLVSRRSPVVGRRSGLI